MLISTHQIAGTHCLIPEQHELRGLQCYVTVRSECATLTTKPFHLSEASNVMIALVVAAIQVTKTFFPQLNIVKRRLKKQSFKRSCLVCKCKKT